MDERGKITVDFRRYCPALIARCEELNRVPIAVVFDPMVTTTDCIQCQVGEEYPCASIEEKQGSSRKYGMIKVRCAGCLVQLVGFEVTLKRQKIKR